MVNALRAAIRGTKNEGSGMTPEQRIERARKAGLATAAKHDGHAMVKPARDAFMARFERYSDPAMAMSIYFRELKLSYWRKVRAQREAAARAASVAAETGTTND